MDALEQMALDLEDAQTLRMLEWEEEGGTIRSFWRKHDEFVILKTITTFRKKSRTYDPKSEE